MKKEKDIMLGVNHAMTLLKHLKNGCKLCSIFLEGGPYLLMADPVAEVLYRLHRDLSIEIITDD